MSYLLFSVGFSHGNIGGAGFAFGMAAFGLALRNHYRLDKMQKVLTELERIVKKSH